MDIAFSLDAFVMLLKSNRYKLTSLVVPAPVIISLASQTHIHPKARPPSRHAHNSLVFRRSLNMKFLSLILGLYLAACVQAWSFDVTTKKNFCGKRRSFFDIQAGNNCYNLPSDVSGNVHSLAFCSMAYTRCSITLHSGTGCTGKNLGSATAASPLNFWEKKSVSAAGSKMKSFRIQGCKKIKGKSLDVQTCYSSNPPWKKC